MSSEIQPTDILKRYDQFLRTEIKSRRLRKVLLDGLELVLSPPMEPSDAPLGELLDAKIDYSAFPRKVYRPKIWSLCHTINTLTYGELIAYLNRAPSKSAQLNLQRAARGYGKQTAIYILEHLQERGLTKYLKRRL